MSPHHPPMFNLAKKGRICAFGKGAGTDSAQRLPKSSSGKHDGT